MVSITLSVPEDIKQRMDRFRDINWSGFVRRCIEEKTDELAWQEEMRRKLSEDRDFEQWAVEMGRKANLGIAKRLRKEGLA